MKKNYQQPTAALLTLTESEIKCDLISSSAETTPEVISINTFF